MLGGLDEYTRQHQNHMKESGKIYTVGIFLKRLEAASEQTSTVPTPETGCLLQSKAKHLGVEVTML